MERDLAAPVGWAAMALEAKAAAEQVNSDKEVVVPRG